MTLNNFERRIIMAVILRYFTKFGSCGAKRKYSSKNLVFGNTWLMMIFSEIT